MLGEGLVSPHGKPVKFCFHQAKRISRKTAKGLYAPFCCYNRTAKRGFSSSEDAPGETPSPHERGCSEVDLAKSTPFANGFRFRYAGLGFLWAWIYCTWFSPAVFGDASGLTVNSSSTWIISALFVSLSLLASPFLFKRDLISIRWVLIAAPFANALGAIAMSHQALFGFDIPLLSHMGAAITGVSSGWLWIMWGEFFGSVDLEVTYFVLPLTVAVPLCCIVLTLVFQGFVPGLAVCLLPLISGACLYLSVNDQHILTPVKEAAPLSKATTLRVFRQGIASFSIYVCISFCWTLISYEAVGGWDAATVAAYLIGGVTAIVTAYLSTIFSAKRDAFGMYRWLVPVTSLAFAAIVLGTPSAFSIAFCLITVVQYGFDIVVWIYFTGSVRSGICTGRFAAGMSRGFVQIGVLVGSLLGADVSRAALDGGINHPFVILMLLGCMTAAVLMFFTTGTQSDKEALAHAEESLCASPEEEASPSEDSDRQSCDVFAERYSLTKREHDVLALLATGRSVPYISETLFVSKNTVESHVKAIYRKAGVHSRQELLTCLHEIDGQKNVLPD